MTCLRRRMIEDMQVRNLAVGTQQVYVQQVSRFARHFHKSPELLGPDQIRTYQIYLTNEKKLTTNSIIVAMSALRFLYKITLKKNWSLDEVIPTPQKPRGGSSLFELRPAQKASRHLDHVLCRRSTYLRGHRTHPGRHRQQTHGHPGRARQRPNRSLHDVVTQTA